jgi:metallopeptidase MepB
MVVHNPATREALLQLDGTGLYNNIKEELTLLRNPEPSTHGPAHCHFGHLMSDYDAGYFSYLRYILTSLIE